MGTKSDGYTSVRVLIIGGGFSGLGVAIRLLARGITDFVLLEKSKQLGGTWRDNTYPGCTCDVPSHLYSYSFAKKTDWSRAFAPQPEIQQYTLEVAERFGVMPYVRLESEVQRASWDEARKRWQVETSRGRYDAQFVIAAQGPLHEPRIPELPGLATFHGTTFHSSRWRHDYDLRGKRVAVLGTGSSAIQFVPEIQPKVGQLVLFQRTAPWVLPKVDHAIHPAESWILEHVPGAWRALRGAIYGITELLQLAEQKPAAMQQLQRIGRWHLARQVADPELRRALTPSFTLGCKRMLFSNTYYPALQATNAKVVARGVTRVVPSGVVDQDGVLHEVDTIIFGTGFRVADTSVPARVFGRGGVTLDQTWRGSPEAYLGTTVHGFPNAFFVIGPNTGNGHGSAFTIIEAQARYIADAIETAERDKLASIEVRPGAQRTWNERVQAGLANSVWNAGGCNSWYIDGNGKNSSIYPWTTIDMRWRMRAFDAHRYELTPSAPRRREVTPIELPGTVIAITGGARGIGLETARAFADAGAIVCIGDLDGAAAREAAVGLGPRARGFTLDVSKRESFAQFIEAIERDVGPLEVLVNNAGIMPTGRFVDESDDVHHASFAVNTFGVSLGMKLVLPRMIARGRGHVVNVASLAGKIPVPWMATYVGTKHAVVGLSAAVRTELAGTGVTLSTVMPGVIQTQLAQGFDHRGTFAQPPAAVARAIVASVRTRQPEVVVPAFIKPLGWFFALAPHRLALASFRLFRHERMLDDKATDARRDYEAAARAQAHPERAVLRVAKEAM